MSNARIHTGHGHNSKAGHDRKRFARRRHDIVISFLLASGLVAALAVFAQWGVPWLSQAISNTALNTPDVENLQIGTLTVQTDGNECELMKFDNADRAHYRKYCAVPQRCHPGCSRCTCAHGHSSPPRCDQQILLSRPTLGQCATLDGAGALAVNDAYFKPQYSLRTSLFTTAAPQVRVSADAPPLAALEDIVKRSSQDRRPAILDGVASLFIGSAASFSEEHVQLFDEVFNRLIAEIEAKARFEHRSSSLELAMPPRRRATARRGR